jgi:hypothetical protein
MQIVRVFKPQTERKNFFGVGWCSKFRSQSGSSKNFEREKRQGSTKTEKGLLLSSVVLVQVVLYTKKHGRRTSTNTLSNSNNIIIIIEKTCCIVVE